MWGPCGTTGVVQTGIGCVKPKVIPIGNLITVKYLIDSYKEIQLIKGIKSGKHARKDGELPT